MGNEDAENQGSQPGDNPPEWADQVHERVKERLAKDK
jgi:hypothetical protein